MSGYARVATFDVDGDALDGVLKEINESDGPPEGVPAKSLVVLADREAGRALFVARFDSEEDLRTGSATLDAMTPPGDAMKRVSVDTYEVVLERQM